MPAKPPRPVILEPQDGTVVGVSDGLDLLAGGDDPEDGELSEATLQWSSDRDGPLGTGAAAYVAALSEGTHLIRLTASDSDGLTGFDTVLASATPCPW